jgi:hypothetical protein
MGAPFVSFPRVIGRFNVVYGHRLLPPTGGPRATYLVVPGDPGSGQQYAVQVRGGGMAYVAAGETDQSYLVQCQSGVLAPDEYLRTVALWDLQAAPPAGAVPGLVQLCWIVGPPGRSTAAAFVLGGLTGVAARDTWYSLTLVLGTTAPRQIVVTLPPIACPG